MKAVILAAGEGTRLNKGWTIVPKPLLEIGDKTIIEQVILSLRDAGINEFVIVVGFMSEHIKDFLRNGADLGVKIDYVYNKDYKGDMLHSLHCVKEVIKGPFILCMADLFFESSVASGLLTAAQSSSHHRFCIDTKLSKLKRIEEKVKVHFSDENLLQASLVLPTYNAVDCALYLFQDSIFPHIERCLQEGKDNLPLVMSELALENSIKVHDIGDKEIVDIDREKDVDYVLHEVLGAR